MCGRYLTVQAKEQSNFRPLSLGNEPWQPHISKDSLSDLIKGDNTQSLKFCSN